MNRFLLGPLLQPAHIILNFQTPAARWLLEDNIRHFYFRARALEIEPNFLRKTFKWVQNVLIHVTQGYVMRHVIKKQAVALPAARIYFLLLKKLNSYLGVSRRGSF